MKLRNRNTYMTSLPEGRAPANERSRITQSIYVLILMLVVFYIGSIIFEHLFTLKAPGFVEVDKHQLSPSHGGHVQEIYVQEGDRFNTQDPLVRLDRQRDCSQDAMLASQQVANQIANKQIELASVAAALEDARQRLPAGLSQALELERGHFDLQQSTRQEIAKQTREKVRLQREIKQLQTQLEASQKLWEGNLLPAACRELVVQAQFAGHVYEINKNQLEFVERGERLLTVIPDDAEVHIDFYIELDSMEYLVTGQVFSITFPDGTHSEGKVSNILSSAYKSPLWEREKYRPVTPQLRVSLKPLTTESAVVWRSYDQLQVKVQGAK